MEHIAVDEHREEIPDWAAPPTPTHGPVASQRMLDYIRSLASQKDLGALRPDQRTALLQPEEFWHEETTRLSKAKAHRILDQLIPLRNKLVDDTGHQANQPTTHRAERFAPGVPAGRYAIENDEGELRFYKVWISRDGKLLNVYVMHGPDESSMYHKAAVTVLNKIKTVGIRNAAIRFGMEIGSCSNCGRRLTNRISRELGIGPVCGGRMFGDDFKQEVREKRLEIIARGQHPDDDMPIGSGRRAES